MEEQTGNRARLYAYNTWAWVKKLANSSFPDEPIISISYQEGGEESL